MNSNEDMFNKGMSKLNSMLSEKVSEKAETKVIAPQAVQITIPQEVVDRFAELKELHILIKRTIVEAMGTKKLHSLNYGIVEDASTYVFIVGDNAWN
jgi:hypothetical protein